MATIESERAPDIGLERLLFFSDAVIAIAITLLALEIRLPELSDDASSQEMAAAVFALWPRILSYVVSFLVIGLYWVAHHRISRYIIRYDNSLIWLNLLFLMTIAFVPFPTALLGANVNQFSVIFYAANLMLTGITFNAYWCYASYGHRLIDPTLNTQLIRYVTLRGLTTIAVFALSILIALVSPLLASLSWVLIVPIQTLIRYRGARDA